MRAVDLSNKHMGATFFRPLCRLQITMIAILPFTTHECGNMWTKNITKHSNRLGAAQKLINLGRWLPFMLPSPFISSMFVVVVMTNKVFYCHISILLHYSFLGKKSFEAIGLEVFGYSDEICINTHPRKPWKRHHRNSKFLEIGFLFPFGWKMHDTESRFYVVRSTFRCSFSAHIY